jgi:hypothetical protein
MKCPKCGEKCDYVSSTIDLIHIGRLAVIWNRQKHWFCWNKDCKNYRKVAKK